MLLENKVYVQTVGTFALYNDLLVLSFACYGLLVGRSIQSTQSLYVGANGSQTCRGGLMQKSCAICLLDCSLPIIVCRWQQILPLGGIGRPG